MAYEKQTFEDNKTILEAKHLNHIEEGIKTLETNIDNLILGTGGGLTTRQVAALNAMFELCAYNTEGDLVLPSAYAEFRYVFGLDSEKIIYSYDLTGFSFVTNEAGVKCLNSESDCICLAFNCTTNTNYKIIDSGTHNRFRFYGRLALDDEATAKTHLLEMDSIIADKSTNSTIDDLSEITINSGNNQTIYIYLVAADDTLAPSVKITEV